MDYEILIKSITEYESLCSNGMRSVANAKLQNLCHNLEKSAYEEYETMLKQLVHDICETDTFAFLFNRGNGQIPYQLKSVIRKWLYPRCRQSKMPELRWFYRIFKNDPDNAEFAHAFLDIAYVQYPDDPRTQDLVFERNIDSPECGLYELPTGLLISDEDAKIILQQCDTFIQHGNVPKRFIDRFQSLKQEYITGEIKNG